MNVDFEFDGRRQKSPLEMPVSTGGSCHRRQSDGFAEPSNRVWKIVRGEWEGRDDPGFWILDSGLLLPGLSLMKKHKVGK